MLQRCLTSALLILALTCVSVHADAIAIEPYLQVLTNDSIKIIWWTDYSPVENVVHIVSPVHMNVNAVTGIMPGTQYARPGLSQIRCRCSIHISRSYCGTLFNRSQAIGSRWTSTTRPISTILCRGTPVIVLVIPTPNGNAGCRSRMPLLRRSIRFGSTIGIRQIILGRLGAV